jgi:hypothetical protein
MWLLIALLSRDLIEEFMPQVLSEPFKHLGGVGVTYLLYEFFVACLG